MPTSLYGAYVPLYILSSYSEGNMTKAKHSTRTEQKMVVCMRRKILLTYVVRNLERRSQENSPHISG
jgi:hypothetical protein